MDSSESKDECAEALHRIYQFLDGELTAEKAAAIQRHLDLCPPCIGAFEFEAELRVLVSRGCREVVPEELRRRVAAILAHEAGRF
jgi:mycothiol system anti-sigma-R factor